MAVVVAVPREDDDDADGGAHGGAAVPGLTIDELARVTGVTVRNIRAYQSRGLLPPPDVRARTGYYGSDHRARLQLIQELTGEGVKLDTVKKLLDTTGGDTEQVVDFIQTVRHLFSDDDRAIVGREELAARFATTDDALLRKAQRMGLLRSVGGPDGSEQFEEVSPRLVAAGAALVELGIPLEQGLEVVAQLRRHAEGIARVYVDLFLDQVWKPFDESGRPEEGWQRLHEVVLALRGVAGEALLAVLELAVAERLDVTFGRDITRTVRTARSSTPAAAGEQEAGTDTATGTAAHRGRSAARARGGRRTTRPAS